MKLTTQRPQSSHSGLCFWGADSADRRDLSKAVGRYNESTDELYIAGSDDLSKKVKQLIELGVNLRAHRHRNQNYFIASTFATPTSTSITEMQDDPKIMKEALNELTEPEFKSAAMSFSDFVKQPAPEQPPKKPVKKDKKKSLSETEQELIDMMRSQSSDALIAATLAELKEGYV